MKPGIHPTWYPDAVVTCACGNTWTTGSTKKEIHTDVCNKCHPFFTGEQRIVDTAGQVERFMKRINAKEQIAAAQPSVEDKKAKKEKRRERKGTTISLKPTVEAPSELPLAVVSEAPATTEAPAVEQPAPKPQAPKAVEPVKAEAPVEESAPVAEHGYKTEESAPAAVVEEPAPVAGIEETAPVAQVEKFAPVSVTEESTPVVASEEPTQISPNDLTIIEGIGPKIASVLQENGITTLEQLSNTSADKVSEILKAAGLNLADPGTWSQQAKLAAEGKVEELHKLQDELTGGRRTKKTTARKPRTPRAKKEDTEEKAEE